MSGRQRGTRQSEDWAQRADQQPQQGYCPSKVSRVYWEQGLATETRPHWVCKEKAIPGNVLDPFESSVTGGQQLEGSG